MNIVLWILLGALAGYLASLIMGRGGRGGGAWLVNVIIGILGAGIGGFVASALGLGGVTGFNLYSLLVAVAGACLLLGLYNLIRRGC